MSLRDPVAVLDLDIRGDLDRIEALLHSTVTSDQPLVAELAMHLIVAGGKRFRPMLVLLAGHLGDPAEERLITGAAAVELTHLATLYHDDVIDETTMRRGVPTVNARYGNSAAVLAGDFLFARASALTAGLGTYVSQYVANTIAELCEGQIMETEAAGTLESDVPRYLEVIRRKTASLMAASCHVGAWLSGAPAEAVEAATRFGEALGMAFQISDDILDVAGHEEESGKIPGTDLREGVLTLPALTTLAGLLPGGDELRGALTGRDVDAALRVLRENGSIEHARGEVGAWQQRALDALSVLPDGKARSASERLVGFIGERTA